MNIFLYGQEFYPSMQIQLFDFILHIDQYLQSIAKEYAAATYAILFMIIFLETGIVITPFLPGDSLLFAAGALASTGTFSIELIFLTLFFAAVLGDTVNYHIGKYIGPQVFKREDTIVFHKKHLIRTQIFFQKHGKKAIIIARFIPVIRTFAPFVAGVGSMSYVTFLSFNILGALLWCSLFIFSGYLFGNIPWVKEHFGMLVVAIIVISLLPLVKEVVAHYAKKKKSN